MNEKCGLAYLKDAYASIKARDYKKGFEQVGKVLKDVQTYVQVTTMTLTAIAKFGAAVGRRPPRFEVILNPFKGIRRIAKESE